MSLLLLSGPPPLITRFRVGGLGLGLELRLVGGLGFRLVGGLGLYRVSSYVCAPVKVAALQNNNIFSDLARISH